MSGISERRLSFAVPCPDAINEVLCVDEVNEGLHLKGSDESSQHFCSWYILFTSKQVRGDDDIVGDDVDTGSDDGTAGTLPGHVVGPLQTYMEPQLLPLLLQLGSISENGRH